MYLVSFSFHDQKIRLFNTIKFIFNDSSTASRKNARKFELNRVIENAFIIFVSMTFPHITLSSFPFAYLLPCVCRLLHLFRLFSLYSIPAVRPLSFSLAAGTNRNFSGR